MIRDSVLDTEPAEPAIGEVHLHFTADQPLRADRKDIPHHQTIPGVPPTADANKARRHFHRSSELAAAVFYVRCSSTAVSSLGMSSITSCPHASSSCHQRRSPQRRDWCTLFVEDS